MTIREYPNQYIATLVANTTYGTQGVSSTLDSGGYASLTAVVTYNTGTGTQFRVWIQGSIDNGTNWFALPVTNICRTVVAAAGLSETSTAFTTNAASIIDGSPAAFTGTTIYVASVNAPPPLIRAAWNINGTSPVIQFGIQCCLSQAITN